MFIENKRVFYSPDVNEKSTIFLKHGNGTELGNRKKIIGTGAFRLQKDTGISPVRFLLRLGAKVASAVRVVTKRKRSCRKVSSSTGVRSRSLSDPTDSHRATAVEDCIQFLHSSSSRERPT